MFSRYDFIIWIFIVSLAIGGIYYHQNLAPVGEPLVNISINGEEYEIVSLLDDNNNYRKEIQGVNGLTVIEIRDQKVRVISSTCPDKLCIHSGWIDRPGQMLVCLPNRVVVKIVSDEKQDIDFYTN